VHGSMKPLRRRVLRLAAGAAALAGLVLASEGTPPQTQRTIKLIVPSAPGGATDLLARLLGEQIGRTQGATVVIDNRPGAGEVIGTEAAARAALDGNTLLFAANPFLINPHLRNVNYDPLKSFAPICQLATAPTLIVVSAASPYHTLADVLAAARTKPNTLTMASIGPGSPFHLGFEKLKRLAKVDMTFIPYPGNGPSVNALLGQHVTMMFGTYANVAEHLKAGRLRALAATTRNRIEQLPDLPTVAESGFPDYEIPAWFGSFAPAQTPQPIVSELAAWLTAALQAPEIKQKLLIQGLSSANLCGAEFAGTLRAEFDDLGRIIRESHIKAE
jgi:tripartite-type tricarboxylate transporter receptor subunit TctC